MDFFFEQKIKQICRLADTRTLSVFGAGKCGACVIGIFAEKISYVIDNDEKKRGTTIEQKSIYLPAKLLQEDKKHIFILIASAYKHSISKQLENMGFEKNIHFTDFSYALDYMENDYDIELELEKRFSNGFINELFAIKPQLKCYLRATADVILNQKPFSSLHNDLSILRDKINHIPLSSKAETEFISMLKNFCQALSIGEEYYMIKRFVAYTKQINILLHGRGKIWHIAASQGFQSLLMEASGYDVLVSDAGCGFSKSYCHGLLDWLRESVCGLKTMRFRYNPEVASSYHSLGQKFDCITMSAFNAVYAHALNKISQESVEEVLIRQLKPFFDVLSAGGIFQSRSENWFFDYKDDHSKERRIKVLAEKLSQSFNLDVISAGFDMVYSSDASGFNLQMVLQKIH